MTGAVPALDLTFLAAQTFDDPVLEREVLELFVAQARALVPRLVDFAAAEQTSAAHLLKGSCQGVGAVPLADLLDRYGRADQDERRRLDLDVRDAFRAVAASIEDRLASL